MSSFFEGLCYAILEASAMGIATIATNIGGTNYSVKDGKTGILIEPGNLELLAEKLFYLIDNPDKLKEMGETARMRFLNLFTKKQMLTNIDALYNRLLASR